MCGLPPSIFGSDSSPGVEYVNMQLYFVNCLQSVSVISISYTNNDVYFLVCFAVLSSIFTIGQIS